MSPYGWLFVCFNKKDIFFIPCYFFPQDEDSVHSIAEDTEVVDDAASEAANEAADGDNNASSEPEVKKPSKRE